MNLCRLTIRNITMNRAGRRWFWVIVVLNLSKVFWHANGFAKEEYEEKPEEHVEKNVLNINYQYIVLHKLPFKKIKAIK